MIIRKKGLLFTLILIISIQSLIYLNNAEKTSFKFFIWNSQEIKLGKLISISFISGFLISTFISNNVITKNINRSTSTKNNKVNSNDDGNDVEENYNQTKNEIPPQRDVRDTQPTISVNYRVIKNSRTNFPDNDEKATKSNEYIEDWTNNESDW